LTKLEEEENNPMKALENRTVDSKREMDILDALQDIRARNARNERIDRAGDASELLQPSIPEALTEEELERLKAEAEDEELVRQVFSRVDGPSTSSLLQGDEVEGEKRPIIVKRKAELLEDESDNNPSTSTPSRLTPVVQVSKKRKSDLAKSLGIKVGKGKAPAKLGVKA
jgi:hypothetical protein